MISYAQNAEDVVLERAFAGRASGLYLDVGAADPNNHSVTRHFYEKGWRGINIDPLPEWHRQLEQARPEDVNLLLGISDAPGEMTLQVGAEHPGGATFLAGQAEHYRKQGMHMTTVTAKLTTLAEVCAEWVGERQIDFLKIDAEGYELQVIKGADWDRWRPRVVVVEATEPNGPVPNHQAWEPLLLAVGYIHALFDGLNRYYVNRDDAGLAERLAAPANVFDEYVPYDAARTADDLATVRRELETAQGQLQELTKEHSSAGSPSLSSANGTVREDPRRARDYAFYAEGMTSTRVPAPVLMLRRALRRLQRPWFFRQVEILNELKNAIDAQEIQIGDVRRLLDDLRSQVAEQDARSWDQAELARRLAALEDALTKGDPRV